MVNRGLEAGDPPSDVSSDRQKVNSALLSHHNTYAILLTSSH